MRLPSRQNGPVRRDGPTGPQPLLRAITSTPSGPVRAAPRPPRGSRPRGRHRRLRAAAGRGGGGLRRARAGPVVLPGRVAVPRRARRRQRPRPARSAQRALGDRPGRGVPDPVEPRRRPPLRALPGAVDRVAPRGGRAAARAAAATPGRVAVGRRRGHHDRAVHRHRAPRTWCGPSRSPSRAASAPASPPCCWPTTPEPGPARRARRPGRGARLADVLGGRGHHGGGGGAGPAGTATGSAPPRWPPCPLAGSSTWRGTGRSRRARPAASTDVGLIARVRPGRSRPTPWSRWVRREVGGHGRPRRRGPGRSDPGGVERARTRSARCAADWRSPGPWSAGAVDVLRPDRQFARRLPRHRLRHPGPLRLRGARAPRAGPGAGRRRRGAPLAGGHGAGAGPAGRGHPRQRGGDRDAIESGGAAEPGDRRGGIARPGRGRPADHRPFVDGSPGLPGRRSRSAGCASTGRPTGQIPCPAPPLR